MTTPSDAPQPAATGAAAPDEAALTRAAVHGDEEALCVLLRRYGPAVRERLAPRINRAWRGSLDEDDVMQVTYLEAFLLVGRFRHAGEGSFGAWLWRIAENNLRDALRGLQAAKRPDPRRRVDLAPGRSVAAALVEVLGAADATPSRDAAATEAVTLIDQALASLPPDYERVLRLYDIEGQNAQEVGARLGRSTGAVYMLRARAHARLRDSLGSASKFFSDRGRA